MKRSRANTNTAIASDGAGAGALEELVNILTILMKLVLPGMRGTLVKRRQSTTLSSPVVT